MRVAGAWRGLGPEQRLAAYAAIGLFVTMFLPWYQRTGTAVVKGQLQQLSQNLNAFQAFSFVEAAVLLVAAGVLALLFARAEGRAFHLPGGDGSVILAAGIWVCLLVFYRQLDKPGGGARGAIVGVQWGIFVTFIAGLALAYAGHRVRAAHRPEPPLPYERPDNAPPPDDTPRAGEPETAVTRRLPRPDTRPRRRPDPFRTDQLSLEDPPPPPDLGR
ncbi:MAG: hypothetical protein QOI98_2329 [Solirubrobacteraceae bacterium]|jgi:hypothetical protein|nr:hypothetical protein [Solirubrobacteraceae bacterium]